MSAETLTIDWQWWSAQTDAREALASGEYDIVDFRGGYGSGKSVLGSRWITETALEVPNSDNLIMAVNATEGKPTTYRVFFEELPGEDTDPFKGGDPENSPLVADYHGTDRRITLHNGAVLRLGGADKWNRFAGSEFNAIWCDEVAHYQCDLFDLNRMLVSRQRTDDGPNQTLWTTTGNGFNQYYDFAEKRLKPDGEPLETEIRTITADMRNNPFLPEDYLEKMQRQFGGSAREEQGLSGGFAAEEGLVYDTFSRNTHVIKDGDPEPELTETHLYGYDYGYANPRVLLCVTKTPADQYYVHDMYYEERQPVEDLVDPDDPNCWVRRKDLTPDDLYADHDPEHIEKFRDCGFRAEKAPKDIDEGIQEVRSILQVDEATGEPGLLVKEGACDPLINEFQSYKEEHVGKRGAPDHALDSLRYAIMGDRYTQRTGLTRRKARTNVS